MAGSHIALWEATSQDLTRSGREHYAGPWELGRT